MPITKHGYIVKDVSILADTIRKAFAIARSGRPGPVLVDITKDVTAAQFDYQEKKPDVLLTKNKHDDKLDGLEEICFMEKLITRKEAAEILGISIATLDAARNNGLISYVQYVQNGCVYFTSAGLQEYIAKCTHRAKPAEKNATYRKPRRAGV